MADLKREDVIRLKAVADKINLLGIDLSGVNLSKLCFNNANLKMTDLSEATIC